MSVRVLCLTIFLIPTIVHAVLINEVLPNPGSDWNSNGVVETYEDEYIELFNPNNFTENITGLILGDVTTNYTLNGSIEPNSFLTLFGNDTGIKLNNDHDSLFLYNATLIDNFSYTSSKKNISYGRFPDGFPEWFEMGKPTPGRSNVLEENCNLKLRVLRNEFFTGISYTKLFRIDRKGCGDGPVNVSVLYNITSNQTFFQDIFNVTFKNYKEAGTGCWYPLEEGNYTICGEIIYSDVNDSNTSDNFDCKNVRVLNASILNCNVSISIESDLLYQPNEKVNYKILVTDRTSQTIPVNLTYWVTDLCGSILKKQYNLQEIFLSEKRISRTWTPPERVTPTPYILRAHLLPLCNDSNFNDNYIERIIIVNGTSVLQNEIKILKVSPETPKFGSVINVDIEITRSNTKKYAVYVRVERDDGYDVSSESVIHLKSDGFYTLRVPVQLKPNCNQKFKDGTYKVVVEGLGIKRTKEIEIRGVSSTNCKTERTTKRVKEVIEKRNDKTQGRILSPSSVKQNDTLKFKVILFNPTDDEFNATLYSYIYSGHGLASVGGWKPNPINLILKPNSTTLLEMENRIKKDTIPGNYTLKVRVKGLFDLKERIEILPNYRFFECRTDHLLLINPSPDIINFTVIGKEKLSINLKPNQTERIDPDTGSLQIKMNGTILGGCKFKHRSQTPTGMTFRKRDAVSILIDFILGIFKTLWIQI